jgi:hypothetical protein
MSTFEDPEEIVRTYKYSKIDKYRKDPGSGNDEVGFFTFLQAVYNRRFYEEDTSLAANSRLLLHVRCDVSCPKDMPAPTALHEEDEETGLCKFCGSSEPIYGTTNSHYSSLSNSNVLRMPFHGYKGFIGYLELSDPELEALEVYTNTNMARTLQELFKLMLEWEWVYNNLDNTDVCAILAHDMLQEMNLPNSLREWVWSEVPDMDVAKFLKNDPDARARNDVSLIPAMTSDFEGWCWYKIYNTENTWKYGSR